MLNEQAKDYGRYKVVPSIISGKWYLMDTAGRRPSLVAVYDDRESACVEAERLSE